MDGMTLIFCNNSPAGKMLFNFATNNQNFVIENWRVSSKVCHTDYLRPRRGIRKISPIDYGNWGISKNSPL